MNKISIEKFSGLLFFVAWVIVSGWLLWLGLNGWSCVVGGTGFFIASIAFSERTWKKL